MDSQQLWLLTQDLHKINVVNISAMGGDSKAPPRTEKLKTVDSNSFFHLLIQAFLYIRGCGPD